jgi:hypothetical protein
MRKARKPNWETWRGVPNVMIWEAVSLSLDIEPSKVSQEPTGWNGTSRKINESEEFKNRAFMAVRNIGQDNGLTPVSNYSRREPKDCQVALSQFSTWAQLIGWNIPPQLAERSPASPTPTPDQSTRIDGRWP